jgi:hypothetical protein
MDDCVHHIYRTFSPNLSLTRFQLNCSHIYVVVVLRTHPPKAESEDTTSMMSLVVAPVATDERTEEVRNDVEERSSTAFPGSKTDDPAELHSRRRLALEWTKLDDKPGGANNDDFGTPSCLSGDGKVLAVGAIDSDPSGTSSGSVHVYEKSSTTGLLVQRGKVLALTGLASGAQFGWSVSLSDNGNILAVGAPGDSGGQGTVRLYTYTNMQYTPFGPILTGTTIGDRFGHSVSLSGGGTKLAVGAPNRPFISGGAINGSGTVQVYQVNSVAGTIVPSGPTLSPVITMPLTPTYGFGYSVSLSDNGDFLGISTATAAAGQQVVRIYERQGLNYVLVPGCTLTNGEAVTFSGDGISNRFAVRDIVAGVVKVYQINAGACNVVNTAGVVPISSNFGARDEILFSLSDDGNVLAIADTPGFIGNVLVYELLLATTGVNQMEYKQRGLFINVPGSTAVSLSDDGKLVAIGTPSRMGITGGFEDNGFTYLYEWKSTTTSTVIPPIVSSLIEQVSIKFIATTSSVVCLCHFNCSNRGLTFCLFKRFQRIHQRSRQ